MIVSYCGIEFETKPFQNQLDYINQAIEKRSTSGFFKDVVLHDNETLDDFDYSKQGPEKYFKTVFEPIGLLRVTFTEKYKEIKDGNGKKYKIYYSYKYNINKTLYLILYSIVDTLNHFDKSDTRILRNHGIKLDIDQIVNGIYHSLFDGTIYQHKVELNSADAYWEHYYYNLIIFRFYIPLVELYKKYSVPLDDCNRFKTLITYYLSNYTPIGDIYFKQREPNSMELLSSIESIYSSMVTIWKDRARINPNYIETTSWNTFIEKVNYGVWLSNDKRYKRDDYFYLESVITSGEHYCSDDKLLKQIKKYKNLNTLKSIAIRTEELSRDEINNLKRDFATFVAFHSPLIKRVYNAYFNSDLDSWGDTKIYLNIDCNPYTYNDIIKGYRLQMSFRQYNQLCDTNESERETFLFSKGINLDDDDCKLDLHSAVFTVARIINLNKFDIHYDIKKEIVKEVERKFGINLKPDDIKPLLFLCFFGKSKNDSYQRYKNRKELPDFMRDYITQEESDALPLLTEEQYLYIYDFCQNEVGGTLHLLNNAFAFESIFEINVKTAINKHKDYYCENVYDCFYFDKRTVSKEEVAKIITKEAKKLYKKYNKYLTD